MGKIKRVYQGGVLYDLEDPEIRALVGSLTDLDTEDKSSIVAAVNETVKNLGAKSYSDLSNKPTINGVVIDGNKTNKDLGLADPSDAQVSAAVSTWLDNHPEATTTVEDGSITYEKLHPDTIQQLSEENMANGLTDAEKSLMLSLFKAAAYTENVSAKVTQLEALWSGSGDSGGDSGGSEGGGDTQTYTVTNNLTNVTNSNSVTTVSGFYSATLSVEDGYIITATITMGGVDITDDVYGEGNILIPEVTGDIVITAEATLPPAAYTLTNKTFTGTAEEIIDTGIAIDDTTTAWSLFLDADGKGTAMFANADANGYIRTQIYHTLNSGNWPWNACFVTNNFAVSDTGTAVKCVVTHKPGEKPMAYGVVNGELVSYEGATRSNANKYNVQIGGKVIPSGTSDYFVGTINTAEVYLRVLPEDEIKKKLGVA